MKNETKLNNIVVIIPVRNEAETLPTVLNSLKRWGLTEIRVIDNGSTDNSAEIAQKAGVQVISEPLAGYGRACWQGLQDLPPDIEWVLFCDADGSDDLTQLGEFWQIAEDYDLILSNRFATPSGQKAMTPVQRFGNHLASFLIRLGWGYQYHDLGPLRLIRRDALEQMQMEDRGFGWTVEMQVKAIENHLRLCEIPVNYRPRQGGKSKISGTVSGSFKAGTIILTTLGKFYLRRLSKLAKTTVILPGLLILLGTLLMVPYGDFRDPSALFPFWLGIGIMGIGFIFSGLSSLSCPVSWFWLVTILSRVLLLFMYPGNDIWRYLWEGYIQNQGFSPYQLPPDASVLIPYHTQWWSLINHPNVTAIYPPIAQGGFRFLSAISPNVMLFKSAFAVTDVGICWLLSRYFGYPKTLFYAWNPLVIYSFSGGGHYDSWFILPLVAAVLTFDFSVLPNLDENNKREWFLSALFLGVSVGIKWISLPLFSFLLWQAWQKVNLKLAMMLILLGSLPLVISAIPFCSSGECPLIPTGSDFVSKGRSAEFLPHLLGYIWSFSRQVNWIYLVPLMVSILILLATARTFRQFTIAYFFSLYIFSPIIHAWYFTWIIPFAVATQNLGVRLVSLSAFIYFILPYRESLSNHNWYLTNGERIILWLPFLLGYLWTILQIKKDSSKNSIGRVR